MTGLGSALARSRNILLYVEINREIFSMVIFSLPLIQQETSVSGERMCTSTG